ncbi:hypothetical protein NDU88_006758 [Pleurodeles waltl]|uniref:Uncharacterized protein n=1 Tax=Pleurodeles waltl TaxID=8319 RepID=A0AAV7L8F8_PLEWA|nr:hypothetical protein NDU88_006758 [Pleurodeles waltl]
MARRSVADYSCPPFELEDENGRTVTTGVELPSLTEAQRDEKKEVLFIRPGAEAVRILCNQHHGKSWKKTIEEDDVH